MNNFDWNYLYLLISSLIGILSGFQAIYSRYPTNALASAFTVPGLTYLFTRGALPGSIFAILYYHGWIHSYIFLYSLAVGTGAEAVLRSQILLAQSPKAGGGIDQLIKGPLDLLGWYQDIFLVAIATRSARPRLEFVKKHLPPGDFKTLCTRVRDNSALLEPIPVLETEIRKLESEFDNDNPEIDTKNERYRRKLGILIVRLAGKEIFKALLS